MLPHFRGDGLVVTRAQNNYYVGDVVAYHNRQLHTVVMHRVVARDGNRFVLKGDNNKFADRYHPAKADLIGQEWLYWPGAGRYLRWLRNPATFGVASGVVALFAFSGPGRRGRKRVRHHLR